MTKNSKPAKRNRYKNEPFLKALGDNCRKIRLQKGYSIDRLSKESEQLSPASIDRLERGQGDSQILVLLRYANALNVSLLDLLSFIKDNDFTKDDRIIPYEEGSKQPAGHVPVFPLKVAAGRFSNTEYATEKPLGWVDANLRGSSQDYFASYVSGDSMSPKIADGNLCLFKKYTGGTRQGKIFLVRAQGLHNIESGESFVVKKYSRQTPPKNTAADEESPVVIHLISENPRYSPIVLVGLQDSDVQTIAEFIRVL